MRQNVSGIQNPVNMTAVYPVGTGRLSLRQRPGPDGHPDLIM